MQIELRELSIKDGPEILEMLREIGPGENGFLNDGYDMEDSAYAEFLHINIDMSRGIGLQPGWVPQTRYWLFAGGRPVGVGKQRDHLTDRLRRNGGHIGYCIRPSERGKGYGKLLLGELLKKAKAKKIPRALVTCNADNYASRAVAEYNGGQLARVEDGECYYWFPLTGGTGIREIHTDDYSGIHGLWTQTAGVRLRQEDSEENIRTFLHRNPGMSFCYEENGVMLGTILCGHDGRRGFIYHTAVAGSHRGRGIGGKLVESSLQRLREANIHKCHLFVIADNEPGAAFWRNSGWTRREDVLLFGKEL